jgi:CRISPR-associated protein Csb2
MSAYLCVSITLIDRKYHGRNEQGANEWPPSPLRLFQSLVAAAGRLGTQGHVADDARAALEWLEQQDSPTIIAPPALFSQSREVAHGYVLSVPNNAMDIAARAWVRGNIFAKGDANPSKHRTLKRVNPTCLLDGSSIHYLWPLPNSVAKQTRKYLDTLTRIASHVVCLGWGIDLAVGRAVVLSGDQVSVLLGERWIAGNECKGRALRVPVSGTLEAIMARYKKFLQRVRPDGTFDPVPPLPAVAYRRTEYRKLFDPTPKPFAAFSLLKLDVSGFKFFDPVRSSLKLAGMMRHAVKCAARVAGWPDSKINSFVLGHAGTTTGRHVPVGPNRFAYLPIPSIERRGAEKSRVVGGIRRIVLAVFADNCETEIAWARRALSGCELIDEELQEPVAVLSVLPTDEKIIRCYTAPAETWATVTPVILPGYDDPSHYRRRLRRGVQPNEQRQILERLNARIEGLLRKAIVQAGFSQELAANAELEWRKTGFWQGTDLADRYGVPHHLRAFSRWHVRLRWRDSQKKPILVPGPICIGGGRYYGLGLFAAMETLRDCNQSTHTN